MVSFNPNDEEYDKAQTVDFRREIFESCKIYSIYLP